MSNLFRKPASNMSALSRALLHHLQEHGPATTADLRAAMTAQQHSVTTISSYLNNLRCMGYLVSDRSPSCVVTWALVQGTAGNETRQGARKAERPSRKKAVRARDTVEPSAKGGEIVPPRRVDVMAGTYRPGTTVLRPGSQDFAALPSLHMGRTYPPGSWMR